MTAKTTKVTIDKSAPAPAPEGTLPPDGVVPEVVSAQAPGEPTVDPLPPDEPLPPAQGVAPRMVATTYGGIMVCLSTATVYDGAPRPAVECGWLQDQLDAKTMYEVKE